MAITITNSIAPINPAYNPIVPTFTSTNVALQGFRYLVDIYATDSNTVISRQKIVPQIDGSGKVDVSRILSNYVSVDYPYFNLGDASDLTNSYFNYDIKVGEEYQTPAWNFTRYKALTSSATSLVYTILSGTTTPPYAINDQILINISPNTNPLYGLHKVISSGTNYVGVNVLFTGNVNSFTATTGATIYADGRKTAFSGLTSITGLTVFNGVNGFQEQFNYSSNLVNVGTPNTIREMLTDLPFSGIYMTQYQTMFFNVMLTTINPYTYYLIYEKNGTTTSGYTTTVSGVNNKRAVAEFYFSFDAVGGSFTAGDFVDIYVGRSSGGATDRLTKKYRIFYDNRCTINDYEIHFMDRKGSIGSFMFQLRSKETGTIERIQYKKQVPDFIQTFDRGTTNIWIGVEKELELNTNWMSEEMSIYFEQLLTSPYTWLSTGINESFQAITIVDSSFEVEYQKNKRLIRKTIKIRFANQDAINI